MKRIAIPANLVVPEINFRADDGTNGIDAYERDCQAFHDRVAQHLRADGYIGQLTGKVVRFPYADGFAEYMLADTGRTVGLVHMPLWDAWDLPDAHIRGLRKADLPKHATNQ